MGRSFSQLRSSILAFLIVGGAFGCAQSKTEQKTHDGLPTIQVGWMTSWATTGQIMETLIHTNIAGLYKVPLSFRVFLYGPNINEAALHGDVDCINVGLVPAISILAASDDWIVVAKLIDAPMATTARTGSGITSIKELKGKTVAVPFGGGAHPYMIQKLEENGLSIGDGPNKVRLINLNPSEQPIAMAQGSVDAVGTWEPQTAIVLSKKLGHIIDFDRHVGVIIVRKGIADKYPDEIVNLLKAYIEANFYVAKHRKQTDDWFATDAHLDDNTMRHIKVIEPNVKAKSIDQISIDLTAKDLALVQKYADTMYRAELIAKPVNFVKCADLSFLQNALRQLKNDGYESTRVETVVGQ